MTLKYSHLQPTILILASFRFPKILFRNTNKQIKGPLNIVLLQYWQLLYCLYISKFLSEPTGSNGI